MSGFGQGGSLEGVCCMVLARISHEEYQKEGYNKTISIDSTEYNSCLKLRTVMLQIKKDCV